jgi:ferredoxin-NADP reductase
VAERGAVPRVPAVRRRALGLVRSFTSPLLPDDYLELIDPLWTTRELRGRVERVQRESPDAVTVLIKPGWEWPGHRPGQYLRLGVAVDGRHHWRAYSLTSEPGRADGCISITPKLVPSGAVSPFLCERLRPGAIVRLGGVEGTFTLPDPPPRRLLFVSAGSGITPIASMLRSLAGRGALGDVVHVHSTRTA